MNMKKFIQRPLKALIDKIPYWKSEVEKFRPRPSLYALAYVPYTAYTQA